MSFNPLMEALPSVEAVEQVSRIDPWEAATWFLRTPNKCATAVMNHESKEPNVGLSPQPCINCKSEFKLVPARGAGGSKLIAEAPSSDKLNRFTIRDVAQLAGVSTATVSNVVNDTGKVGRATRERVRAAIQSTNWKPNKNARNLAKR